MINLYNFIVSVRKSILLIVANWSFVFGMLSATVVFSNYIFGDDNLYEELVEMVNYIITKEDVDLSPASPEDPESELHKMQMLFSQ